MRTGERKSVKQTFSLFKKKAKTHKSKTRRESCKFIHAQRGERTIATLCAHMFGLHPDIAAGNTIFLSTTRARGHVLEDAERYYKALGATSREWRPRMAHMMMVETPTKKRGHAVIVEIGGPVCGIYTTSAVTGQDGFLPRAASQQKNVESCKSYVTERKDYPDATRISFTWRKHDVCVAQKVAFHA